jgi:hypothetical protein
MHFINLRFTWPLGIGIRTGKCEFAASAFSDRCGSSRSGTPIDEPGVTFKKTLIARERDRPDIGRHRARRRACQALIDSRRLVFLNETWTKPNMTKLRGCAEEHLIDEVPQGKWKTATFLAALRDDRIDAPCLFDDPSTASVSSPNRLRGCRERPGCRRILRPLRVRGVPRTGAETELLRR